MKKYAFLLLMFFSTTVFAQIDGKEYKVVFDITSHDTAVQQKVLRWATSISKDFPEAEVEIVFYGSSLDLVQKNKSVNASKVAELASSKNVSFRVCRVAMKKHEVDASDLIAGVGTVPDGLFELVLKQRQGWGYIKVTP